MLLSIFLAVNVQASTPVEKLAKVRCADTPAVVDKKVGYHKAWAQCGIFRLQLYGEVWVAFKAYAAFEMIHHHDFKGACLDEYQYKRIDLCN